MSEDKQQKENQKILNTLLEQPHNKFCADCGVSRPTWASAKLGVFICMKCAGIHRALGTHISFVRSVSLDKWKPSEIETIQTIGNLKAAQIYEGNLPPNYPRPSSLDLVALEKFIRAKYQYKKFYSETPNINIRRASVEKRSVFNESEHLKDGPISPRKVIRKTPPINQQPSTVRAPDHLVLPVTHSTLFSSPLQPAQTVQATTPMANTIDLFGPISTPTTTHTSNVGLFGSLEVAKGPTTTTPMASIEIPDDKKACSTATKNEILSLFDQLTPTQPNYGQNLGNLFGGMAIGIQNQTAQPQQYQLQFPQQQLLQQQLYQQQLYQQQLQQQLQQQQLQQIQQQHDFALLNKIQSKSQGTPIGAALF